MDFLFLPKYLNMHTASIPGFIRTILIIILIYYAFKLLARIFLPFLMRKMMQKAGENLQKQAEYFQQQQNQQPTPPKQEMPKSKKQVGEYVDFEEVD